MMRDLWWILRDRTPVPVPLDDILTWGRFMEQFDLRRVAEDIIEQPEHGRVRVGTVFLGIDQNYSRCGPPLLFESMVFGGPLDRMQHRYATWNEAAAGHRIITDVIEGKVSALELVQMLQAIREKAGSS